MKRMKVTIWHNPRCSKSRETLALLKEKGILPDIVEYLVNPPSRAELADIVKKLGISPKELIRFKEPVASELGIRSSDNRPDSEWLALLVGNPVLIERPVVIASGKAVIGRPPENVLKLIA